VGSGARSNISKAAQGREAATGTDKEWGRNSRHTQSSKRAEADRGGGRGDGGRAGGSTCGAEE
jgi:hypothetical protein